MVRDKDVENGKAVQQQLRIWDVLLEIRIRLQKMLIEANKLPQDKQYWTFFESTSASETGSSASAVPIVKSNIENVLQSMLELKRVTECETPYQLPAQTQNQIEQITSDKERLLRRTKVKRTKYNVIGKIKKAAEAEAADGTEVEDFDPEIFDDDDFYHQILRELIERKTTDVTDPVQLSRHWLELQKLRSKIKRKVDTRASKARKIRYEVYPKLINLMAPAEESRMEAHAINELFSSVFNQSRF